MGELVPRGLAPQEHHGWGSRALGMVRRCQLWSNCYMPGLCRCTQGSERVLHTTTGLTAWCGICHHIEGGTD